MIKQNIVILIALIILIPSFSLISVSSLKQEYKPQNSNIVYVSNIMPPGWYDESHVHTIQEGVNNVTNGGIVYVYNGTYNENITIASKTITMIGESNESTIITYDSQAQDNNVIEIINSPWCNISGFKIIGGTSFLGCHGLDVVNSNYTYFYNNNIAMEPFSNNKVLYIYESNYFNISNNYIFNGNDGVASYNSGHGFIYKNEITDVQTGIEIKGESYDIDVYGNNIHIIDKYGIELYEANYINIIKNEISYVNDYGIIAASDCSYLNIYYNYIQKQYCNVYISDVAETEHDCYVYGNNLLDSNFSIIINCHETEIYENNIVNVSETGIVLYSDENLIYHNNIYEVGNLYGDDNGNNNRWNETYPTGGNYWDNYTGVDFFSGPNQNIPGSDGIGDTNYTGIEGARDRYPLMNPWGESIIYVDDDYDSSAPGWGTYRFDNINDGIDNVQRNGTVYVFNGTYYENVHLFKPLRLLGENVDETIIYGNGISDVVNITSDYVQVIRFTIMNGNRGIYIYKANDNAIYYNKFVYNNYGVYIE